MNKIQIQEWCSEMIEELNVLTPREYLQCRFLVAVVLISEGKYELVDGIWDRAKDWYYLLLDTPGDASIIMPDLSSYIHEDSHKPRISRLGLLIHKQANKVKAAPKPVTQEDRAVAESTLSSADIEKLFEQPAKPAPIVKNPEFTSEYKPGSFRYKVDELVYLLQARGFIVVNYGRKETATDMRAKIQLGGDKGYINVYHGSRKPWHVNFSELRDTSYKSIITEVFNTVK